VAKLLSADRLLRLRKGDDFGVTGDVTIADRVVDRLCQDLSLQGDDRPEWVLTLAHRDARQLDAARHHRLVSRFAS